MTARVQIRRGSSDGFDGRQFNKPQRGGQPRLISMQPLKKCADGRDPLADRTPEQWLQQGKFPEHVTCGRVARCDAAHTQGLGNNADQPVFEQW